MGSCSRDIKWLVMGERDVCGLIRKAVRRLNTHFPKLLSGGEGGDERLMEHLWEFLHIHLDV